MNPFQGFPDRMEFTPVPNLAFSALFPEISDLTELKVALYVMAAIYSKKGSPQYASYRELLGNTSLVKSLGDRVEEGLAGALAAAVERGVFLSLNTTGPEGDDTVYLLNSPRGRDVLGKIQSGEVKLGQRKAQPRVSAPAEALPDIFTLYEQNIGVLTPLIAEELQEVILGYPEDWVRDAFLEAVSLNKRSLRYIVRILENWAGQGRSDGTHRRDIKMDPDKYIRGKYGHIVKR